jgi:hypothetical protein
MAERRMACTLMAMNEKMLFNTKKSSSHNGEYKKHMFTFDNDGNIDNTLKGFPVPQNGQFRLILVTHDESTFWLIQVKRQPHLKKGSKGRSWKWYAFTMQHSIIH